MESLTSDLSEEDKAAAREQFLLDKQCTHCGGLHLRACRRVKKLIMRNREEISEVQFWQDGKWTEDGIIWPEDVFDGLEETEPDESA